MIQITNISDNPHQILPIILEGKESITLILDYYATQNAWFWGIEYGDFKSYGNRLCVFPNLLRQHINILSFGMLVTVEDGGEPWFLDDFSTGRVSLYFVTKEEALEIETEVFNR